MRAKQKINLFSSALVLAVLFVTAGTLTAQDVRYNFMPRTDFSKYRTYKWVNIRGAHPDQIMDAEIKQSVDSQLASKGLTKTDSDKADLYIGLPDRRQSGNTMGCLGLTLLRHGLGIVDQFDHQCRDSGS